MIPTLADRRDYELRRRVAKLEAEVEFMRGALTALRDELKALKDAPEPRE